MSDREPLLTQPGQLKPCVLEKKEVLRYEEMALRVLDSVDQNVKISTLDLSGVRFSHVFFEELCAAVKHNLSVKTISFEQCCVSDKECHHISYMLKGNSCLKKLSLADNFIRSIGAGYIARALHTQVPSGQTKGKIMNCELQSLNLNGNSVGPIGAKSLCVYLVHNRFLEELHLRGNAVDDWGCGWFGMYLRNQHVLKVLDLRENPILNNGLNELETMALRSQRNLLLHFGDDQCVVSPSGGCIGVPTLPDLLNGLGYTPSAAHMRLPIMSDPTYGIVSPDHHLCLLECGAAEGGAAPVPVPFNPPAEDRGEEEYDDDFDAEDGGDGDMEGLSAEAK